MRIVPPSKNPKPTAAAFEIRQHVKRALRQAVRARRLASHAIEDHPNPTSLYWQEQASHVLADAIAALHNAQDATSQDQINEAHGLARRIARLRQSLQELAARDDATPAMRERMQAIIDADDFLARLPDGPLGPTAVP